ncbi:MAG: hypothetical protein ACBR12_17080 [Microcoleus sp.]
MRVISRKRLKEFWETHPNAEISLLLWYQRSCDAEWQSLVDMRKVFPSADLVDYANYESALATSLR